MRREKILLLLVFYCFSICLYSKEFSQYFFQRKIISLHTKGLKIGYLRDLKIVDNKIVFVDVKGKQVLLFDQKGYLIKFLGKEGQGPGEFSSPEACGIDNVNNIYVVDYYTRRINIYYPNGSFKTSFIIPGIHWTPHIIKMNKKGQILLGGYKENFKKPKTGWWINVYTEKGKYLKSFFKTNPKAAGTDLAPFSKCWFDLDEEDYIYAIQETYYKVYKFNPNFILSKTFGKTPAYYVPPKHPPNEKGV